MKAKRKLMLAVLTAPALWQPSAAKGFTSAADSVGTQLSEAVVTGTQTATDLRHLPMTVSVVARPTLTEDHRPNMLSTLAEQVPGLMVTGRGVMGYGVSGGGSGGMMLRGISSGSGQVMVLIDGHPQFSGIYGHSVADSYPTFMADRVEVLRGPASLLYGSNAMGGVVNIVSRQMHLDGVQTQASIGAGSYGTLQAEASNQVRHGRFSSTVAGSYGRSDNHRPHMGIYEYGGYVHLGYALSDHWDISAQTNLMHFAASWPGTVQQSMLEADQWITRGAASLSIGNHYGRTSGRLSVYDNFGRHKINDGYAALGGTPQSRLFRSRDALAGVNWWQAADLWKGGQLTIGLDYQHIYGRAFYTDRQSGTVLDTPNKQSGHVHNNEWGAYAELRQDLATWLTLDAGARFDHHSVSGGEWVPQAGIVARPMPQAEAKLMVSKGFRNPTMRELYLYPPSNENLLPERLMNYEISWRHRLLQGRLNYGLNAFYIHADNLIQTINRQNVNTGELHNAGVEADMSFAINDHWSVTTNHSYLHMKHPVVSAPVYKGYAGGSFHAGAWNVHAGVMQVAGLYTATGSNEQKECFTLVNATVDYRVNRHLTVWTKGENLLGQHYQLVDGNPMPKATFLGGVSISL